MSRYTSLASLVLCAIFALQASTLHAADPVKVDVCVYGGTCSGVVAAAAVVKQGKTVILIEPGRHLGGLSSGGLGETDIGNKMVIGGISREFYRRAGKVYDKPEAWKFEPHVAEEIFAQFIAENKVRVIFENRLAGVEKQGTRIVRITIEKAPTDEHNAQTAAAGGEKTVVEAAQFIDATYEGDLMAGAKVSYTVGREASAQYDESLNGVRAKSSGHVFTVKVDPYLKPGDPTSGLIPYVQPGDGGKPGDGDKCVQSYNFRICLTSDPADQLPFTPPADYDAKNYELLARYLEARESSGKSYKAQGGLLKWDLMLPSKKTDINNNGAVSTDFIGQNYAYPDAAYPQRGEIWRANLSWVQGLFYFLSHDARSPQHIRDEMSKWGLCKDEFKDTGGWPHQMYVREARRMVGPYVVTQAICEHKETAEDSIGMAAYNMDSHNCQRFVKDGAVYNEGDVEVPPRAPYPIAYRAMTPKQEECENLLVPVCLSATHIAYGSIRMEPVFMVLGESAAVASCHAIDEKSPVQKIDVPKLQKELLAAGQVLQYTAPAKGAKK